MAWGTPTNIGTNNNASGGTLAITSVTVSAGEVVVVLVEEIGVSSMGTVVDGVNAGNYTSANSGNNATFSAAAIYVRQNTAALSGATITYTKIGTGACAMSAFHVSGGLLSGTLVDLAPTATTGNSTSPTITSASAAQSGELFIGAVGYANSGTLGAVAGFTTPPPTLAQRATAASIGGAYLVNAGTTAKTYNPALGTSGRWVALLVSLKVEPTPIVYFPRKMFLRR